MKEQNAIPKTVYKDMQHNNFLESNITFHHGDIRVNMNTKRIGRPGIEQESQSGKKLKDR
jgi:hypothetical protein